MSDMNRMTLSNWSETQGAVNLRHGLLAYPQIACLVKRAMDFLAALAGGLLLLPVIGLIAVLIKATSRGPIFYCQKRLGRGGREFHVWKFRTMFANADRILAALLHATPELEAEWKQQHKITNDPRITRLGRWLRKTSLDELPQLWNVVRGEMSLVGPRPIVRDEISRYAAGYALYQRVRPGITGLWQVSGRNDTTYQRRVQLDMTYVRTWSLALDFSILLRTVRVVLSGKGAY